MNQNIISLDDLLTHVSLKAVPSIGSHLLFAVDPNIIQQLKCLGIQDQRLMHYPISMEQAAHVPISTTLPSSSRICIQRLHTHMDLLFAVNNVPGIPICTGILMGSIS